MALTAVAFWLVYAGGLIAALHRPIAGVVLYILVYHLNPEDQWWGESVRAIGLRTSFVAAAVTVLGILVREPRFAFSGRQITLPVQLTLAFALLATASLAWGPTTTDRSIVQVEKFAKVIFFVLLLVTCVRTPAHFQMVIASWLAGVAYIGYQAGGGVGVYAGGRLTGGLGGSDFAESSGLAVHMVASLPLAGAMVFMARRWWTRGAGLLIGALIVNTIILTRTRNALIGIAALLVVGVISLPRRYRLVGFGAIVAGAVLALQLADPGWWRRMETMTDLQGDASTNARLEYWAAAVAMAADYPLGIGIGKFHQLVMEYVDGLSIERSAHSTFMTCLAELGGPGLLLLLTIIGLTMRRMGRVIRRGTDLEIVEIGRWQAGFHFGWHAMALRTALAGYLACGLFTTRIWAADLWMLIGLAACLDRVAREAGEHEVTDANPATGAGQAGRGPRVAAEMQPALVTP
ncbi:MAG: hypothetical protein AMXMBFR47_08100 [Planctomycetota bacterium]